MGVVIGASDAFSTWGRCRTPIFNTYFGATGANAGAHNLTASQGYVSQANTFFRCAQHWYLDLWDDGTGTIQTAWYGPFAFPGPPFPASTSFIVGALNAEPGPYAPNFLDDVEIQAYWVGRNVVIDATTYTMDYSALNGVYGSFQTITASASVISFDL